MGLANDATHLRTASVRQDQRKYCVLVLRTHPVGSVVQKRHRFSPVLLLILQISSPLLVTHLLFMKQSLSDLYVNMPLLR